MLCLWQLRYVLQVSQPAASEKVRPSFSQSDQQKSVLPADHFVSLSPWWFFLSLRDPRLEALNPSWFKGKRCLDIGCNAGDLTIAVGMLFFLLLLLPATSLMSCRSKLLARFYPGC